MNLATLAAATTELKNALSEASAVIEFVRSSPKRLAIFGHQQDRDATGLRSFSRTRWTCNERSLKSLLDNWTAVLATLTAILSDPASASDAAAKAQGFRRAMEQFDFIFMVKLGLLLFQLGKQLSVGAVLEKIRLVREATPSQRKDAAFSEFWATCTASAEELELDQPRRQFFAALDKLAAAGLKDRFCTGGKVLQSVEDTLAGDLGEARRAAAFYGLDEERLLLHVRKLGDMGQHPTTMTEAASLMTTLGDLLPEVAKLVRLGLIAPATSCTAERSFSLLKRLKS
ncbi:hypothetical protein FJT64_012965 [Amphibalanus amphitrite]|uniref:HAT C-terminal dimerisation domain-containing protein n=1 Tax=Amphibalanus amphitrite TaxID=1232801 RepID=A0A6A4VGS5_AMPAM|nr:hypothetical protein FJT64_012965 [Amphibalanus amphitrite]